MLPIKSHVKQLKAALVMALMMSCATALADEPDAKSVPKPILMLGLFCNSALSAMKAPFEANPLAPPWLATGSRLESIKTLMNKLDTSDAPYEKAIRDRAITAEEAQFMKFSAQHESGQWLTNINQSCVSPNFQMQEYETCLKETNSEIYKCYRIIIDSVQSMGKSPAAKQ